MMNIIWGGGSTGTKDESIEWDIVCLLIGMVTTFINCIIPAVFIMLAPKIIMIWLSLER